MKLGTALTIAVAIHAAILAALIINVSLDRPERPQDNPGNLMHATFVPPAKGNPNGGRTAESAPKSETRAVEPPKEDTAARELEAQIKKQQEAEQARMQALEQQRLEEQQKVLALKKAEAEKQKLEEQKKLLEEQKKAQEQKKAEEQKKKAEAKAKAEAEKKKAEELKKKAEAEAKAKAEAEKKKAEEEAKKKAEAEAKKKAEAEARRKAEADAKAKAQARADSLEDDILGTADGDAQNGRELGSGGGDGGYGSKIRGMIENNWHVDTSMNGKKVMVTLEIDSGGMIKNESCKGDDRVCKSALDAIQAIGMFPAPPSGCAECSSLVIYMTPKI